MTDQERQQAFIEEYNALTERYGLTFAASLKPEQLGAVVQVRPELVLAAIEGWKPTDESDEVAEKRKEYIASLPKGSKRKSSAKE